MRQDASRSIEIQSLTVIPQWIAGHADPGSMLALDRALGRWLAKQSPERNQRVGYARGGKFDLSMPPTEEEVASKQRARCLQRAAKKYNINSEDHQQIANAVAEKERQRRKAICEARNADLLNRIAALPVEVAESFNLIDEHTRRWTNLHRAEWVMTLTAEEREIALKRRTEAQIRFANKKNGPIR